MTLNRALLKRTLRAVETAPPGKWDQTDWRCGTTMCFAGFAAELTGGQWSTDPDQEDYLVRVPEDGPDVWDEGGTHVADRARRVLGLSSRQASNLFWASNTLEDLQLIVADLLGE